MSLKVVHVVFIAASIVLCFLVGAWALREWRVEDAGGMLALSVLFYVGGAGLVVYGLRFLRKMKEL